MWTVESQVGRLIELQIASPVDLAELALFGPRLAEVLGQKHRLGQRVVACTDLSAANLFAPEVADRFIGIMARDNPMLERSAFLIGPSAMFALQLERMFKQASSPLRRAFRDATLLAGWLGEVLTPEENVRLRLFLRDKGRPKP